MSNYRMINDYISLETANVIDLGVDVDVILDASQNQGAIVSRIIEIVTAFFSPLDRGLGQNINVSALRSQIQQENGVISLSGIFFFNKVGGEYSSSQTSQQYEDPETKLIKLIADTIFAEPSQIYQVRFPSKDIRVSVLNLKTVNFS